MSKVIVFAIPVFLLMIAAEYAWGVARGRNSYRFSDAINSMSLGMLSQISGIFTRLLRVGIYVAAYEHFALVQAGAFWTSWAGWLLALLFYDFCYYWQHRLGHESALFWASHVVHHQSQHYNLSTALRQTSSGALLGWIFYLPMALAGVPPLVFGIVALIDLLYQFWVHTEHVPKLGWFDRWFCSPSNHRVHHAVNDAYLDRNYGGILVVWDRLFGSFVEEGERCVYGTRKPLNSWNPVWANLEIYWDLARDSWRTRRWADKLRVWFKPPGWKPADLASANTATAFRPEAVVTYAPPVGRNMAWFTGAQFALMLLAVAAFLWVANDLPWLQGALWFGMLLVVLCCLGAALEGKLGMLEVLWIECAALATVSAALELRTPHLIAKPLVMALAFFWVLLQARSSADVGAARARRPLLLAIAASLAGDVFLIFPGFFIPGLASFLVAHLAYLALFRQGVGWFPQRRVLVITTVLGAAMYGVLWTGLPSGLRAPVAVYVLAITLMAAQAIGRAWVLRTSEAKLVALGALVFMLSDGLLAVNLFVTPLPLASLWVLSSYFAAQLLMVRGVWARRA